MKRPILHLDGFADAHAQKRSADGDGVVGEARGEVRGGRLDEHDGGFAEEDAGGFFEEGGEKKAHEETGGPVGDVRVVVVVVGGGSGFGEGGVDAGPGADGGAEAEADGEAFGGDGEEVGALGGDGEVFPDGGWGSVWGLGGGGFLVVGG